MADQEDRGREGVQAVQNAQSPGEVHAGEGLIQEVEPCVQGQTPGQGQPAAHPAGQGGGKALLFSLQFGQRQKAGDLSPALPGEDIGKVLFHRPPGEEAVLLKEDGGLTGGRSGDGTPLGPLQTRQYPQKGGLDRKSVV